MDSPGSHQLCVLWSSRYVQTTKEKKGKKKNKREKRTHQMEKDFGANLVSGCYCLFCLSMAAHPVCLLLHVGIVLLGALLACGDSKFIAYNTSRGVVPGKLNVHLVPHSHDDVGWLRTIDQHYKGFNNSIQGGCVENVTDSPVPALLSNPDRKFIYVEQAPPIPTFSCSFIFLFSLRKSSQCFFI